MSITDYIKKWLRVEEELEDVRRQSREEAAKAIEEIRRQSREESVRTIEEILRQNREEAVRSAEEIRRQYREEADKAVEEIRHQRDEEIARLTAKLETLEKEKVAFETNRSDMEVLSHYAQLAAQFRNEKNILERRVGRPKMNREHFNTTLDSELKLLIKQRIVLTFNEWRIHRDMATADLQCI